MLITPWSETEVLPELRAQVWELQEQAWPSGGFDPGLSRDPALDPRSMLLVDGGGRVLAALDLLSEELAHAGEVFTARGLSCVVTDRAHRGRGHGGRPVAAARRAVEESGADLGLFTCDRVLGGFYESAGWAALPGTVLVGGAPEDPAISPASTRPPWRGSAPGGPGRSGTASWAPGSPSIRAPPTG
ncbi:hypothetical protein GCM10010430_10920 [Kitasatospora cystarginea]|uniref:Acetyltransferase n=1 Tax=Kitasatospora cystarginea TaxID=58350 RepID=A0ABP5QCZ3_9ACTN